MGTGIGVAQTQSAITTTLETDQVLPQNGREKQHSLAAIVKRQGRGSEVQMRPRCEQNGEERSPAGEAALAQAQGGTYGEAAARRGNADLDHSRGRHGYVEAGKGAYGGPDRKGCNTDAGGAGAGVVSRGMRRGGADDGERRSHFEELGFGEQNGKSDWAWLKFQRSSASGAAFMLDARLGSIEWVHKIRQAKERGPGGEGEPREPAGEGEEEHDGNITSVNKLPNLGGQSAIVHGPSMAAGEARGAANVQRVVAQKKVK
ncbi:hypothetical protein B0H13DRAFT_1875027 [Mycena leptocephala]|nr:hypothetical protein B0H13DRAFT_1875027 [Mycena leptocephala]